ncbi:inositol monophosphatase [bacterium]|nr:inositol monophosphatase [bacterium]
MSQPFSPEKIQPEVERITRLVGEYARREFKSFSSNDIEYKGKRDLFSYVDVTCEVMIKEELSRLIPGAGFINEEGENQASQNDYTWLIDPIDGTTNFIHGIPFFSISIALEYDSEIILGYVYDVMTDELFSAAKGKGATLNGERIHVSETEKLQEALLATGFPYDNSPWLEAFLQLLIKIMQQSHGLRRFGSAAIDLSYVACGRLEGFFEFGLSPWDVAAGTLIVQEAGGKVTDIKGGDNFIFGKQMVASNGHIHDDMLAIMKADVDKMRHFPQ